MMQWLNSFLNLAMEAAPWLVLGMLIAGLIKAWIPMEWVQRHLGGKGIGSIFKAALLGAPLPLCSCSVIPVTLEVRRRGASPAATVSFLVSTPETGADSISVSYALLGPFMAVIRPLAALSGAVTAGLMAMMTADVERKVEPAATSSCSSGSSCCGKSSCSSSDKPVSESETFLSKTLQGVRYGFTDVWNDMVLWLLVGLAFAAAVNAFLPSQFLQQWGSGPLAMIVMMLVGVPMYICATASTPIAAGLLMAGVSPGTVLVFLLAGPATNMATLGLVRKELGGRVLTAYLTGIAVTSFAFGLLTDYLVQYWHLDIQGSVSAGHELVPAFVSYGTSAFLVLLTVRFLWQKWGPAQSHSHSHAH